MKRGTAPTVHLLVTGSADFVRRMGAAARTRQGIGHEAELTVAVGPLAEARSLALSQRPNVVLVDTGFKTTTAEIIWLRALLTQLRERFEKSVHIVVAVTNPETLTFGGTLLFTEDVSLQPSGLVDSLLIAPPPGMPNVPTLEEQLTDCLRHIVELAGVQGHLTSLPSLADECWAPAMCDPESRNVWMRWLPRYARYVNENPLIVGPTGSGKTRLAAAIHQLSGRKGPFVSITPRDFSSTELVQAELFGAVPGAYTGAVEKWGLVRRAEKGTLFIDELQSIDRDLQGKLITFVENKVYRRVGEAESHHADVRFIFATNRSLQELVDEGALRDDFAYRLERLQITLPPLAERRLDIAAGAAYALAKVLRERAHARAASPAGRAFEALHTVDGLTSEAYRSLFRASWPGNLRQLENTIAKLVEVADIEGKRLIDETCVTNALEGLLGQREITSADILGTAARQIAARASSFPSLAECSAGLTEAARSIALDVTGGDAERATLLLHDSSRAMELFAATRER